MSTTVGWNSKKYFPIFLFDCNICFMLTWLALASLNLWFLSFSWCSLHYTYWYLLIVHKTLCTEYAHILVNRRQDIEPKTHTFLSQLIQETEIKTTAQYHSRTIKFMVIRSHTETTQTRVWTWRDKCLRRSFWVECCLHSAILLGNVQIFISEVIITSLSCSRLIKAKTCEDI